MDLLAGATGGCCSGVALGSKSGSALLRFDIANLPSRSGPHPSPGSQRTRTTASGYSIVVGRRLRRLAPNPRHPGGRRGRTRWSVLGLQVELCVGDHLGRRLCRHPLSPPAPRLRRGCPGAKESGASRKTLPETPSSCAGVVVGGCHATCPAQDDGGAPMVAVDEVGRAVDGVPGVLEVGNGVLVGKVVLEVLGAATFLVVAAVAGKMPLIVSASSAGLGG